MKSPTLLNINYKLDNAAKNKEVKPMVDEIKKNILPKPIMCKGLATLIYFIGGLIIIFSIITFILKVL